MSLLLFQAKIFGNSHESLWLKDNAMFYTETLTEKK